MKRALTKSLNIPLPSKKIDIKNQAMRQEPRIPLSNHVLHQQHKLS